MRSTDTLTPCGSTICAAGNAMTDEDGHPVAIYHADIVDRLLRKYQAVVTIHVMDPVGIVPVCAHCRTVWPCATKVALETL